MRIESSGHSQGNPRLYELVEHSPKTGKSPTVWAWPELMDYLKIAGQPVPGPWPPHQQPRPDPEEDTLPVAVAEPPETPVPPEPPVTPRQQAPAGQHRAPSPRDDTPPQLAETPSQEGEPPGDQQWWKRQHG
jgi:hypothetical protein